MVVVGVAYVVRPFGAMIVGPLGDRYGRRFVLMLTLFLMGAATFAIGCLPTYSEGGHYRPDSAGCLPHASGPLRRR